MYYRFHKQHAEDKYIRATKVNQRARTAKNAYSPYIFSPIDGCEAPKGSVKKHKCQRQTSAFVCFVYSEAGSKIEAVLEFSYFNFNVNHPSNVVMGMSTGWKKSSRYPKLVHRRRGSWNFVIYKHPFSLSIFKIATKYTGSSFTWIEIYVPILKVSKISTSTGT